MCKRDEDPLSEMLERPEVFLIFRLFVIQEYSLSHETQVNVRFMCFIYTLYTQPASPDFNIEYFEC